jgi:2'-hydroxyisoflavone reductase
LKILMIGGTVFLGRHTTRAALDRGHQVTLFNRGQHNPGLFPQVEKLHGDREGGLDILRGRSWDAVVDFCGYVPRVVSASAALLAGAVQRYAFISSLSVYPDLDSATGQDEDSPVGKMEDESVEEITGETYGPLKVLCEQAVERALPGRALIIRPGLIVGPNDPTDRFTYWPARVARAGDVLAPVGPDWETQVIDVRDLGEWTLRMLEGQAAGVYNATGPASRLTFGQVLDASRAASGSNARVVYADEKFLLEAGVQPWVEMPLWIPGPGFSVNVGRAISAGLTFRPLAETVRDTLAWHQTRPAAHEWRAGMKPEKEAALLQAWQGRNLPQ